VPVQVVDLDDAALEIWRRKDAREAAQIAGNRAVAGLPSQEEIAKAYPSSDEEDREPEDNEAEEASKKLSKKKIKKVPIGTEGLTKSAKTPKKLAIKDGSKPKITPSKVEGTAGKSNLIISPENTTPKKSKKGTSKTSILVQNHTVMVSGSS